MSRITSGELLVTDEQDKSKIIGRTVAMWWVDEGPEYGWVHPESLAEACGDEQSGRGWKYFVGSIQVAPDEDGNLHPVQ